MTEGADEALRQAYDARLLAQDDRRIASQRSQVDNAKLVATFVLALASTLVGTTLQVDNRGALEIYAVAALGLSLVAALLAVLLDTLDIPIYSNIDPALSLAERTRQMAIITDLVIASNHKTTNLIKVSSLTSVALSAAAGVVSCVSLLLR